MRGEPEHFPQFTVPGTLQMVGRLFRSEKYEASKKNLLIFVTPTLIDPARNRAHPDKE